MRSTSQPQFRSELTPATIEADQIFLTLQQLARGSSFANCNRNISRISKLPNLLTTTMPSFNEKSEKIELFRDLFQTNLKVSNLLIEEDKKTISIFSTMVMCCRRSKTTAARTEMNWEKS